ncbi:MAG: prepilin-type N-terminal cleavage/methylation domain-containing protein, partial [Sulfuritalea sp.]
MAAMILFTTRPSRGMPHRMPFSRRGFTLIELAIVMFIVTLLLGGMLLPLSAQQDIRNFGDTQKKLADARDALLGFAMANDRLPCPASDTSNGLESFCTSSSGVCTETTTVQSHGRCAYPYSGYFPAATLGLSPVDSQGYFLDGWGGETVNRVRYAISTANTSAFSTASGMKNIGLTTLAPDLQICTTGTNISGSADTAVCDTGKSLATDAVAVVYSLGKNAGTGGTSTDESHNLNADRAFVNATQGSAFDDQMLWLSKSTLFNRMVAAGRL